MIEVVKQAVDLFLHLDKHLTTIIGEYGTFTYVILFLIIFCETGLVVTPFLPGDSLLFAAGVFAAGDALNVWTLLLTLTIAAVVGDSLNYKLGQLFGEKARFINPKHIARTHEFYEHYGPSTIIIARFVPIVRTFAPFVAGVGNMSYVKFLTYNVVGGVVWVFSLTLGGYFFANVPVVKENFSFVVVAIIFISILPAVFEFARVMMSKNKAAAGETGEE